MQQVTAKSYTLRKENGTWLGQVVLTSDGMYSSVTDYGNFSYAWRHYGEQDFAKFIIGLDVHYFACKMFNSISQIAYGKKYQQYCKKYAEKILPALQKVLKEELEKAQLQS